MTCKELFAKARGVVFDFEGTLVDFQWQLAPAVADSLAALSAAGVDTTPLGPEPGYAQLYNGTLDLLARAGDEPGSDQARRLLDEVYDRYDADALTRWGLRDGVAKVVESLAGRGLKLSLVSNVGQTALEACLAKLGLNGMIPVVISRNQVSRLKPHPGGLLAAADRMGVPPEYCVKVGDSLNDVGAARTAGMMSCYISGGENLPAQMRDNPPDCFINDLPDLL